MLTGARASRSVAWRHGRRLLRGDSILAAKLRPSLRWSVPLVRQHGQRVKLDPLLVQLLGLVRRGLAVDRAVLDLAVVHLARLFGKSPPNIIGVFDEMFAQFLQFPAELALLRRHHGDR